MSRQLYQGAAYRTPIRRVLALPTHDVNAPDFDVRRQAAYASEHTILRDTSARIPLPRGRDASGRVRRDVELASEQGALLARASRVRTLAFGVIVDPNITRPLPFAGLSYLDFNLFGTGAQLNGFFGGTLRAAGLLGPVTRAAAAGSSRAARSASPRPTTTGTSRLAANNTIGTSASARRSRPCGCCVR